MKSSLLASSLISLISVVFAHSIFQELHVNGVSQGHMVGIRVPDYDGPIMDVTSNDLICNGGINPYHQPVSRAVINVPAGAQVTAEWHHTLNGAEPNDPADPIDASHHGPVMAYMAKIPDALQSDVTGLRWFKVYHDGLSNGVWGVDRLISNDGKVTFTVPQCIASGQYLLRVELIALHAAGSYPGAQLYMECAQINVTGGSGSVSPSTVSIPGMYKGSDPGITINIYQPLSGYTIPGPSVFSCSGNNQPPSSSTATSNPQPTTSNPPTSGTVPQWGQCGGQGYTGPTTCVAPYTCHVQSPYYSQCY
ncbi:CAZyme family AA9 [Agaricus bisporus var. burnettii]|uniref:AA9 family lytic polysaccharide monooxygenase n=1 Tax=Agaricus bisporus var. burnettii TaxID=192524 RepID=A0A8H7CC63_AGABI|nr:CAZyme family AA9 [Agaricus bisporus var. burnettii]